MRCRIAAVSLALVLLMAGSLAASAQLPPGWSQTRRDDGLVLSSPKDRNGDVVIVLVPPPQRVGGSIDTWFDDRVRAGVRNIGSIVERQGAERDGDWLKDTIRVSRPNGDELFLAAFAYEGARGFQLMLVVVPARLDENDRRVRDAIDLTIALRRGDDDDARPAPGGPGAGASPPPKSADPTPPGKRCRMVSRWVNDSKMGTSCTGFGANRVCVPTFTPGMKQVWERVCD